MSKVVLSKPYSFEGKEYTEIVVNLETLTGQDIINAASEARILDNAPVPELSKAYLAVVAAKAAGVPVDMITKLPGKDFTKITMMVQNFLFE